MPAESIRDVIRKAIQELIIPDLNKIRIDVSMLNEKVNSLDSKVESFRNEFKADIGRLDEKIGSLDEKVDLIKSEFKSDINHLDEKMDYMNRFNEKLFNLIHPASS